MKRPVHVEVIGFKASPCGPFPCNEDRTCGLEECYPSGEFIPACTSLKHALEKEFGDQVEFTVTLLDNGVPDHVKKIVERYHPPIPLVLVNGEVTPLGRISLTHLRQRVKNAVC